MTKEESVFLSLMKDHVNKTADTVIDDDINFEKLYTIAEQQSLTGVTYIQLKEVHKENEQFHDGFMRDVYSYANQKLFMKEISIGFHKCNVAYLPFKGWIIKKYWPIPELRTMGDIDVLIHTNDREKTDSIMKSLEYKRLIDNHAVWSYYAKDILFELHDHMFYEHLANDIDYRSYFDQVWEYREGDTDININFHFLYLITHLAKHTVNHGMGFRSYLDLIFVCKNANSLNWQWITEQLNELRLLKFTETCFAFCKEWFGFNPPIEIGQLDSDFRDFVTEKLFHDGTFGLDNEQNEAANSAKEIAHSNSPYLIGALDITRKRLFPSYRDMQLIPWYSFVNGRPWLLPAAWVYRWGYTAIHNYKYAIELLAEPFKKRGIIKERQKLIKDWGL